MYGNTTASAAGVGTALAVTGLSIFWYVLIGLTLFGLGIALLRFIPRGTSTT